MTGVSFAALVVGSVSSFVAAVVAARSLMRGWQNRVLEEARNTQAIKDNTTAIKELSGRVERLEHKING